jgi:uncharacterized SAM-binding protein YcdF (DUF218 family)
MKRYLWVLGALTLVVVSSAWLWRTAAAIERQSSREEAQQADIIIVLGAAEYSGRPSPVYEARLNHALMLYLKKLAPRIMTTGGAGGDRTHTEGDVGREYLSRRGVPSEAILVEPEGASTVHSASAAAEIMRKFGLTSCIVVSDGYHIFRVKQMLAARGMLVYGSPRPSSQPESKWMYVRQAIGYALWRAGITI